MTLKELVAFSLFVYGHSISQCLSHTDSDPSFSTFGVLCSLISATKGDR